MLNKFRMFSKTQIYKAAVTVIMSAVICMIAVSCSKKNDPDRSGFGPAVPVTVAAVEQKNLPVELTNLVGTVDAYASVLIKSQVTGVLEDFHFVEGQFVKKGDLLVSIDPRPSEAALKLAQANLQRDEAQLKNAQKEFDRQSDLLKKGFAAQSDYDNSLAAVETLRASLDADKAAVDNASLQLGYCSISSPINGLVGKLQIDKGNLIKLNDVNIVTVNQISPIYVDFSVPQDSLPQVQKYYSSDNKLAVKAIRRTDNQEIATGHLNFIDNAVDTSTGTIRLRAIFDNNDRQLWPGQFVFITLILTDEPNAVCVPSQAVQVSQKGMFVYVVKPDKTVEAKNVSVIRTINDLSVVDGLQSGEIVVKDGQLRLVPGAKVEIKDQDKK